MRYRRVWAAVLSCLLLVGCGDIPVVPPVEETPVTEGAVIAYVPLDDRPDNEDRVVYLAESLGYRLELPERDWYHTALDGQPLNENGTQYGDRARLYEWVLQQEENGCDRYILFLDQLLSGGLVNSRHMTTHQDITLSDGTVLTEYELLEALLTTLAADENNQVWLLDSVMRLAPTCGYDGFGIEEYNALREYGMQPRPELSEDELGLERVVELYEKNSAGETFTSADFGLSGEAVADYCSARSRKLELSDRVFWLLRQFGNEWYPDCSSERFHVLIGIDDSSAEDSIQKNEIAYLRSLLREGDALLSGVDDLAFKAVTRLYLDECDWNGAEVCVEYYGGTENQPACAYDSQPLCEIVEEHLAYFELESAGEPERAQLAVMVLTQPEDPAKKAEYYNALIRELNRKHEANVPVILIDASNNQYGTAFHDALTEKCELGGLLSYAGFLDMAIVTGTAVSHGVARYARLTSGEEITAAAARAFQKSLAEAILLDFCYRNTVRDEISTWVRQQGGDPNNFYAPPIDTEAARQKLTEGMERSTVSVLKNLSRSNLVTAMTPDGFEMAGWGEVTLSDWSFPWQRVFEVRMEIRLTDLTAPHKKLFGIYYR